VRGFIGDVVIQSPVTTGTTYQAQYIPPCDQNHSFDSFLSGTAQGRDTAGVCADIADANKNLMVFVAGKMQAIAGKIKAKRALAADEEAFLKSTPLSVGLILKNATATNTEGEVIGKLAELTARAYGYYMLLDFLAGPSSCRKWPAISYPARRETRPGQSRKLVNWRFLARGCNISRRWRKRRSSF
jgi:conjugative transfer pilus assembly protein TraH